MGTNPNVKPFICAQHAPISGINKENTNWWFLPSATLCFLCFSFVKALPNTADSLTDKFLFSYEEILLFHSRYDAAEVCHKLFLCDAFA